MGIVAEVIATEEKKISLTCKIAVVKDIKTEHSPAQLAASICCVHTVRSEFGGCRFGSP